MAGFHRCRRRCEIQRWRSGIHKTSMETTFWMGVSDILEKADIFNSVWRILKRLIWLGGLGVPAEGIGTASHRILVFSLILDNVN